MTGDELRIMREEMGLLQADLAGLMCYRLEKIARMETGEKVVPRAFAAHLCALRALWEAGLLEKVQQGV